MRLLSGRAALAVLSVAMALPGHAVTCYQLWDRQDTLAYQSPFPPFELAGPNFDRSMDNLRARHGQLMFFDTTNCVALGNATYWTPSKQPQDPASLLADKVSPILRGGIAAPRAEGTAPALGARAPAYAPARK